MPEKRQFPILKRLHRTHRHKDEDWGIPDSISWELLELHEAQVRANHGQSLVGLAARGGLGPDEAVAILEDRRWRRMDPKDAIEQLNRLVFDEENPT